MYFMAFSLILTSCSDDDTEEPPVQDPTLELATDDALGQILTDDEGNSLYFFSPDVFGASACEGACEQNWPVYYEQNLTAGTGVTGSNIGVITRTDGTRQNTYNGWPLYYFSGDDVAGDTNGEGIGNNWFVAKTNYDIMIAQQDIEGETVKYLTDGTGNSLYYFTNDDQNVSNCNGGCLETWPPYTGDALVVPSILAADDFNTIASNTTGTQITYEGRPLYFFADDATPGDINGQSVGGVWFIVGDNILFE